MLANFLKDLLKCFRYSLTYLVMNLSFSDCLVCIFGPFYLSIRNWRSVSGMDFSLLVLHRLAFIDNINIHSIQFHHQTNALKYATWCVDPSIHRRFLIVTYPLKQPTFIKEKVVFTWLTIIRLASSVVAVPGLRDSIAQKNIALQISTVSRAQEIKIIKKENF